MSEEEKAELAEQEQTAEKREGLVQKLHERLKARKGFKRVVARTVAQVGIVLMSTLMLAGFASRSAGGSNEPATNVVYAAEENVAAAKKRARLRCKRRFRRRRLRLRQ